MLLSSIQLAGVSWSLHPVGSSCPQYCSSLTVLPPTGAKLIVVKIQLVYPVPSPSMAC